MRIQLLIAMALVGSSSVVAAAVNNAPAVAPTAPLAANANTRFSCNDLRKASQKLPLHVQNIANRETTRTAEGGPYKPKDVVCKEYFCTAIPREDFRLMYNPAHPDANQAGYVQMPRVNVPAEVAALQSAATEVRLLAQTGACGASAVASETSAMVKYETGAPVQTDTFNFSVDGRLTSWSRIDRDGKAHHYSFNADGTIRQ